MGVVYIYFSMSEVQHVLEYNLKKHRPNYTVGQVGNVWYIYDISGYPYLSDPLGVIIDVDSLLLAINKIEMFFRGGWM